VEIFVIILGITSSGRIARLEQQNRNLNARLETLEAELKNGRFELAALEPGREPVPSSDVMPDLKPESDAKPKGDVNPEPQPISEPISKPSPDPIFVPKPAAPLPDREALEPVAATTYSASLKGPSEKPDTPTRNLEALIGGQWSVWVGGLALLVGAVLLIRFSIEAGIFGPGARILMALALGVALLLTGEWLKRSDEKTLSGKLGDAAKALQDNTSVPGLLSAVGIFTLLGASYAAHALYSLIPAFAAFLALAAISLGAMALSLRQGPILAGIGLLASLVTPLLIQTNTPNFLMLVVYLVSVGSAALVLTRRTGWSWLATGTVCGWLFWSVVSKEAATGNQLALWSAFLALGFITTVWFAEKYENRNATSRELAVLNLNAIWAILWGALAAILVLFVLGEVRYSLRRLPLEEFCLAVGALVALIAASFLCRKQTAHLVTAGGLALVTLLMVMGRTQISLMMLGVLTIVILAIREATRQGEEETSSRSFAWSVFAVGLGLVSVVAIDIVNPGNGFDKGHAATALGFTALFAGAGAWLHKRGGHQIVATTLIIGTGLGWALAALLIFRDLPFSLFLSLGAALAVLSIWQTRMTGAKIVLLGLMGLVFAQALFVQFPKIYAISSTPIFNALWAYLALPALILTVAAFVLHDRKPSSKFDTFLNGAIEAGAMLGAALFVVFQIRHLSNGGDVYASNLGHPELGLQVSIGLCFILAGLSKRFSGNLVLAKVAQIISYVTLAIFGLGSLLFVSPFFMRGEDISGNIIFNSLTTGLLVPAILLALCAVMARGRRTEPYINILGGLSLAGALSWVTAIIRFMYNGPDIRIWQSDFSGLELWTISVIWLVFGVTLLGLGVWKREQALRIASGVVIILTVLKAFLIDMAGLEGVLRALSFVALGLILIVIGRAYQKFWLSAEDKGKAA
jgi:uncharacterized membrane protein